MAIIPVIIDQHAEEAAFLWLLRDGAVRAPHYKLWELAKLDNRVEAHLDGLRVAGAPGWDIVKAQLEEHPEPGEAFTATVLAIESQRSDRIETVLELATESEDAIRGLISGLGWINFAQAGRFLDAVLPKKTPVSRRIAMAAWAIHRQNPGDHAIHAVLADKEPSVQARGARAVGELGAVHSVTDIYPLLRSPDVMCQFWAAWSIALLNGDGEALTPLRALIEESGPLARRALQLAPRRMSVVDGNRWLTRLQKDAKQLRNAVVAAGVIGDPRSVPWLMEQMAVKPLARVAGEAFSMITGVDLAYQDLDVRPPEDSGAGPTEDPKDENVAMDADDNLPWPNPEAIAKWWQANGGQFTPGTRYLAGKPIEAGWLREVLKKGKQRQRAAAALELAILEPGTPLFEVRAPGFKQVQML